MPSSAVWEIVLHVDGPITVRRRVLTTQQKGFQVNDPFYSDIEIMSAPSGVRATVTARAPDQAVAHKAALFFFGRMLDALTLIVNRPMYLSLAEGERTRAARHDVRRVIDPSEFAAAFRDAHHLAQSRSQLLRSLGWYRKGLTTDDPFDRFLAFWNAIENLAAGDHQHLPSIDKERAKNGCKSQVWECFKALWGPCEKWPVIPSERGWIDDSHSVRSHVAHGVAYIDVHEVAQVAERLPVIEKVCYSFLRGWRDRFIDRDGAVLSESSPPDPREEEVVAQRQNDQRPGDDAQADGDLKVGGLDDSNPPPPRTAARSPAASGRGTARG